MKKLLPLLVAGALSSGIASADQWLLHNGEFRYTGLSRSPLSGWTVLTHYDGCSNRPGSGDIFNRPHLPQTFFLKQEKVNSALMCQYVPLPAGKYRVTMEVTPESPACYLHFNGATANGSGKDGILAVECEIKEDSNAVLIQIGTSGIGELGVKKVDMECLGYPASAVPADNGKKIAYIVLPENASPAERFAAWEVMRLTKAMTGFAPEITTQAVKKPAFRIGAASTVPLAESVTDDGFAIMPDNAGNINLCGRNDRGTLYAVYDYFAKQGCAWLTPGADGESIPKAKVLAYPKSKLETSPDYKIRGIMFGDQLFQLDTGWRMMNIEDRLTWALRNRINLAWDAGIHAFDFLDWRGKGFRVYPNHTWNLFITDAHPEWWPLVNGERRKMSNLNLPNQPCLSNQAMRDYAVKYISEYFKAHPDLDYFSLSAEDEPCYWCECENCRNLDSDHGKGPWVRKGEPNSNVTVMDGTPMADRALDFVNYVAGKVGEICPGKKLFVYCYGSLRNAPKEHKIADNVMLLDCYYLIDPPNLFPEQITKSLDGWQKQGGAKEFGIYDYDNYLYPDSIWSGIRYSFQSLKELHTRYNALYYIPESHQSVWTNPLLYRLRADALWGTDEKFETLVKRYSHQYYGKGGDAMEAYFLMLDKAFTNGRSEMASRPIKEKDIIYCPELTLTDLANAKKLLVKARGQVAGDPVMEKRLDWVIMGHDLTILTVSNNLKQADYQVQQEAPAAYSEAKQLAEKYHFDFSAATLNELKEFYMPPIVKSTVQTLPTEWRFQPDKTGKEGDEAKWYAQKHPDWKTISIEKAWTDQGYGDHHGVGWYETEFNFKGKKSPRMALHCGAVDGTAVFYIDGVKIGEQSQSADKMWDKPFTVPLKELAPGKHRITVRVRKDTFAAGIWKPISIVILN